MNLLNERIAALRKERGLTQEQLGQMVGVSPQAVSKWEKGGAPDVDLLPAVADALGVTIDALFGLEGGQRIDVEETVNRWLRTFPMEQRMDRLCRLVFSSLDCLAGSFKLPTVDYPESCHMEVDSDRITYTQIRSKGGMMLNTHAEDFSFVSIWPEPKEGYAAYFAAKSEYRSLFALLARPGCLDVLEFFYTRDPKYVVPHVIAKQLDMPLEEVQALLDALADHHLLYKIGLELENGEVQAYILYTHTSVIPFFCIARGFMQDGGNLIDVWDDYAPLLRSGDWKNEEEKDHEKE